MRLGTVTRITEIAPLADRVAKVLTDGREHSSASIDILLEEVGSAIGETSNALQTASSKAVDPRLDAIAALASREEAKRLDFELARLSASEDALRPMLETAQRREEAARVAQRLAKLTAQRDALAAELAEAYPRLSRELTDLLARVEACDAALQGTGIEPAECVARGLSGMFKIGINPVPRLTEGVALPSFKCGDLLRMYQWHVRISREQRAAA